LDKTFGLGDMMEHQYKHSKLTIIGFIGMIATIVTGMILVPLYEIKPIDGMIFPLYVAVFGVLIMVGVFMEGCG